VKHRLRKKLVWLAGLLLTAGATALGVHHLRHIEGVSNLPAAPVRQGEFLEIVTCRGELVASRSIQLLAPANVPDLRIVWLAPASSAVKGGDAVIRFDASSARQHLAEKEAALRQAEASLDQAVAQARITIEQDKRDLVTSRHQVERAQLEASKADIVSRLKGEEARIDLGLAEDKLKVQEASAQLHKASDNAKVASLSRQRDKAKDEVDLTKERLAKMEIKAPSDGYIIYLANYSQGWMNAKPFKVGDRAWPGSAIAELPDLRTLEMKGKLEEIDRGRITLGDEVRVRIDSLPEKPLKARLRLVSPLTEQNFEWPPTRNFRAHAELLDGDGRLRPGMNGRMDIVVKRHTTVLSIPSKAVFSRNGRPVAYVSDAGRFRAVEIEVLARNPDEVAVSGLQAGGQVALVEPPESAP
jgi:hypothetical protein